MNFCIKKILLSSAVVCSGATNLQADNSGVDIYRSMPNISGITLDKPTGNYDVVIIKNNERLESFEDVKYLDKNGGQSDNSFPYQRLRAIGKDMWTLTKDGLGLTWNIGRFATKCGINAINNFVNPESAKSSSNIEFPYESLKAVGEDSWTLTKDGASLIWNVGLFTLGKFGQGVGFTYSNYIKPKAKFTYENYLIPGAQQVTNEVVNTAKNFYNQVTNKGQSVYNNIKNWFSKTQKIKTNKEEVEKTKNELHLLDGKLPFNNKINLKLKQINDTVPVMTEYSIIESQLKQSKDEVIKIATDHINRNNKYYAKKLKRYNKLIDEIKDKQDIEYYKGLIKQVEENVKESNTLLENVQRNVASIYSTFVKDIKNEKISKTNALSKALRALDQLKANMKIKNSINLIENKGNNTVVSNKNNSTKLENNGWENISDAETIAE